MFKIKTKSRKFNIPLSYFNKLNELTPSQVEYLLNYRDAIKMGGGNPALMERIGIILAKPHIDDPILSKRFDIDYSLYQSKRKKIKKETELKATIKSVPKKSTNFFKKFKDKFISPLRIKDFRRLQP